MTMRKFSFVTQIHEMANGGYYGVIGNARTGSFGVTNNDELLAHLESKSAYITPQTIEEVKTTFGILDA